MGGPKRKHSNKRRAHGASTRHGRKMAKLTAEKDVRMDRIIQIDKRIAKLKSEMTNENRVQTKRRIAKLHRQANEIRENRSN